MNNIVYYPKKSIVSGKSQIYVGGCVEGSEIFNHLYEILLSLCPNAIIWVKDGKVEYDSEEYKSFIERINLVVLNVSNDTMLDKDFINEIEFISNQKVPILPILAKGVSIHKYEQIFGNRQFISEYLDYETALPFKTKLKSFLDAVIIRDAQLDKIKSAFRANIFLSYRKKDRAQANRIMRAIHETEALRDVSIWYDEFLTPGEDYNDEIQSVLKDCDVFVLAVTPSILEPDNYVMVHEYPDACSLQKSIVPIETTPTERQVLADNYNGLPDIFAIDDSTAIGERLGKLLSSKQTVSEDSAEREYLLGMAYFSGIGVERNYDYAFSYFDQASSHGYRKAYQKLISMYLNGDGIKKDIGKAVIWQKKYTIAIAQAEGGRSKAFIDCLFDTGDLTVKYYDSINTPILSLHSAKNAEDSKREELENKKYEEKILESRKRILDDAKKYYDDAAKILSCMKSDDPLFYFEGMAKYSQKCFDLAYSKNYDCNYWTMIGYADDEVTYRLAVNKYLKEYLGQEPDTERMVALAESLMRSGSALMAEFNTVYLMGNEISEALKKQEDDTIQNYLRAGKIFIELSDVDDSIRTKKLTAKAYSFLASSILRNYKTTENADANLAFFANETIRLLETIYLQTGAPEDARSLADAYYTKVRINGFKGDSIIYLKKCVEIMEKTWNEVRRTTGVTNNSMGYQFDLNLYRNKLEQLQKGANNE